MNKIWQAAAVTLSLGLASAIASPALAQIAGTYTAQDDGTTTLTNSNAEQTTFLGAAGAYGATTTASFENVALGDYGSTPFTAGPGLSITQNGDYGLPYTGVTNYDWGSALYGFNTSPGGANYLALVNGATLNFANGTNSFGFFLTGLQSSFSPYLTISFNDGAPEAISAFIFGQEGGGEYVGITDASLIYSVTLYNPGSDAWGIDDISYNTVPEPASYAALGMGMLGMMIARRRRA